MKNVFILFLLTLTVYAAYGQRKDTFEVYFPTNITSLTKETTAYIDRLVFDDSLIHGDKLIILGYADYVGSRLHNDILSRQRAKNVRNYLATMGFDNSEVALCIGKGKIDRNSNNKDGYAPDRKVQIVIDHMPSVPVKTTPPPPPAAKAAPPKTKVPPMPKIDIVKMAVNESFTIHSINFQPGSPLLLPESYPALLMLLGYMRQYPNLKIRIEGHVCCTGPYADDVDFGTVTLSDARAIAIKKFLVDSGISAERLAAIGLSSRNPVVPVEHTEEDCVLNRRVEIRITAK